MTTRRNKPRILPIMAGQHRCDTLGTHGHPRVRTPNPDGLAQGGVDLRRAYTCCGLCSLGRASIVTGLYPHRHGLQANTHEFLTQTRLDPAIPTFPRALQEGGCHTSYAGKVHLDCDGDTDHGDTCGSRRMFDKGCCMYEELHHTPLIGRCPGVWEEGRRADAFANNLDLMATFLALAGARPWPGLDSRSPRPVLEGALPPDWPTDAFAESHGMQWGLHSRRMIVTRIHAPMMNTAVADELHDLCTDPAELHDRLDDPAFRAVQRDLHQRLFRRMEQTGDPLLRDNWWPESEDARQSPNCHSDSACGTKSPLPDGRMTGTVLATTTLENSR